MNEPIWYPLPDKNMVRFEYATERNGPVSSQLGRPVHDKVILATIVSPGKRNSEATMTLERERPILTEGAPPEVKVYTDKVRSLPGLEEALERFKKDQAPAEGSGTPLAEWPALGVSQVADLRGLNIHFVEQLAAADDAALQRIGMGARALQLKAKAFLEVAKGQAPLDKLIERNTELERQMALMQQQMAEFKAQQEASNAGR
jgi:hypothetical protein